MRMALSVLRNPKILLLYKRSSFLSIKGLPSSGCPTADRFRQNHIYHYESLRKIEHTLKALRMTYRKHCRSRKVNYRAFDLVITVGGDGTFLEAARNLTTKQYILGVNSDPQWSVGQFCSCNANEFQKALQRILGGSLRVKRLYRLRLTISKQKTSMECLNDVLICHPNPAAMSRYHIQIGKTCEEHRSSGLWLSTASGSTGAILSAGGKKMPLESKTLQYKPRELYQIPGQRYHLAGGMVLANKKLIVTSRMPHGNIFVDGAHIKFSFPYGTKAVISISPNYVNLLHV
ncbi:MAG: NAD(+)/NADH kinase [Candidatus Omnitrophica bacterium]|nr:NAD(+)/NADH kinase [Candidatus Omnitrophota bacterium]